MKRLSLSLLMLAALLLAACAGGAGAGDDLDTPVGGPVSDLPTAPDEGEPAGELIVVGELDPAMLSEVEVLMLESYPVQYRLLLRGERPTPCHTLLATVNEPTAENEIHVEIVFGTDPELMCAQVIDSFEESIALHSYPSGEAYTVWVNGVQVAEFTAQ